MNDLQLFKYIGSFVLCFLFCLGCSSLDNQVKEVLETTGPQRQEELKCMIRHYKNDPDKSMAAKFLIANMADKYSIIGNHHTAYQHIIDSLNAVSVNSSRNYDYRAFRSSNRNERYTVVQDLKVVNMDSLISQIDFAFQCWEQSPWSDLYSRNYFEQYILPYRISDEPLEYDWRMDVYSRYKHLQAQYKDSTIQSFCSYIYKNTAYKTYNLFWEEPLQSYSFNQKYRSGKCGDHAVFITMIMRALGVPTAIDFIPYWSDGNNGHSFNALILPDGSSKGYSNREDLESGLTLSGKASKIYRKTYEIQRHSLLYKYRDLEYIPSVFARYDLIDVTDSYDIPLRDVKVRTEFNGTDSRISYLCVFSPSGWQPIAWTSLQKDMATFQNVGVGYYSDEDPQNKGEDYGSGCLFIPACYTGEELTPIHYPFILNQGDEARYLIPDYTVKNKVVLKRKFPRKKRIVNFAAKMIGGYFELSNDRDFKDATIVHYVDSLPLSRLQSISLECEKPYRYIRFYKRSGGISLGELRCLDHAGAQIRGKAIADNLLNTDSQLKNICDDNVLSYFDIGNLKNSWVGLDFGKPVDISTLVYCPRTDDNDVCPDDEYELYYWDKEWVSLGKQTAGGYQLVYTDVPDNSLLWLRNITKGVEERPFTYENEKQIWW